MGFVAGPNEPGFDPHSTRTLAEFCERRRDLAERRPRHKEFERAAAHIGEHLGVGPEPAFGKDVDEKLPARLLTDRLRHFNKALDG